MHGHHHHRHGKWGRFVRHNPGMFFGGFILLLMLAAVVLLIWVLSDARFLKADQ